MSLMDKIKDKAKSVRKNIVLPEGSEPRTIEAAAKIIEQGIANVILLGNEEEIKKANVKNVDLSDAVIIDPATSPKLQEYADMFYEMRKKKGITPEQALETTKDPLYYAVLMIKANEMRTVSCPERSIPPAIRFVRLCRSSKRNRAYRSFQAASLWSTRTASGDRTA